MKKFYYVFTVALMLLAGATSASAQEAEANEDLESAIAENFKGLNYDVPALDPEIQATCDELMNLMLTDPAKANKDFSKLMRKNRTKPEALVAMGHYFVMSSKPGMSYFPFANQCQRQAYTAAPTDIRVLMFCAETAMLSRNYGVAGTKFDEILTIDSTYVEAYKQSARVYKMINPYSAIEKLNKLKQFDPSYYLADKELGDIYYMQNQFKDAVEAYDKYYKAVPKTAEDLEIRACIRYCLSLFAVKKYFECQELATATLQFAPDNKALKGYKFFCEVENYELDKAEESIKYLTEKQFADSTYTYLDYLYAAKFATEKDDKATAINYYKSALSVDSTKAPGFKSLADLLRQDRRAEEAIPYYKKYLELVGNKKTLGDDLGLANLYLAASNKDSIEVEAKEAFKKDADNIYAAIIAEMNDPENAGNYNQDVLYIPYFYRARLWITDPQAPEELPREYYAKAFELIGDNLKLKNQKVQCAQYLMLYHLKYVQFKEAEGVTFTDEEKKAHDAECKKYCEEILMLNPDHKLALQVIGLLE